MSDADIFAVGDGASVATGEFVTELQNVPSVEGATPILKISPDRGRMLKILNRVARGKSMGFPFYAKLNDSTGTHVPPQSGVFWSLKLSGMEKAMKISKKTNVSFYQSNDITTQRDADNVDGAKHVLQKPDNSGDPEPIPEIKVRDIDALYLELDSVSQIDWTESEAYLDSNAVETGSR